MSSEKVFKTAFLLSASAHLLVFVSIAPTVNVGLISHYRLPKVDFISIPLDKIYSQKNLPEVNTRIEGAYNFFKSKTAVLNILPMRIADAQTETKESLDYVEIEPGLNEFNFSLPLYENLEISGALRKRMLVSKPDEPQVPAWIKEEIIGSLEVEIAADVKGDVVWCRRIISTGYAILDRIGMDYVRSFKFFPSGQYGQLQYGRVKISFKK